MFVRTTQVFYTSSCPFFFVVSFSPSSHPLLPTHAHLHSLNVAKSTFHVFSSSQHISHVPLVVITPLLPLFPPPPADVRPFQRVRFSPAGLIDWARRLERPLSHFTLDETPNPGLPVRLGISSVASREGEDVEEGRQPLFELVEDERSAGGRVQASRSSGSSFSSPCFRRFSHSPVIYSVVYCKAIEHSLSPPSRLPHNVEETSNSTFSPTVSSLKTRMEASIG